MNAFAAGVRVPDRKVFVADSYDPALDPFARESCDLYLLIRVVKFLHVRSHDCLVGCTCPAGSLREAARGDTDESYQKNRGRYEGSAVHIQ